MDLWYNKNMKNENQNKSPLDWAMYYLSFKSRTQREMENYLDEKQFGEVEVYDAVERLKELGLIDDEKYARDFIDSRLNTKAVSRRHLFEQLSAHFIPKEVIEAALDALPESTDSENALLLADKYYRQLNSLDEDERREKVAQRLMRRGYSFETVKAALNRLGEEE